MLGGALATSVLALGAGLPALAFGLRAVQQESRGGPSTADPWQKLHEALARRALGDGAVHGLDEPELLLWPDSDYLIQEERLAELRSALEAFRAAGPRGPAADGLRRVLLQQELWAAFDWAFERSTWRSGAERRRLTEISRELAAALALSAPTAAELDGLASNLAAAEAAGAVPNEPDAGAPQRPFLPRGLGSAEGDWVFVRDARSIEPLAQVHSVSHAGRMLFGVALRLPEGREATRAWLETLPSVGRRCDGVDCGPVLDGAARAHEHLDPELTAMPQGAQVALVQRALAFDDEGELRATPLVQRVQVRAFLALPEGAADFPRYSQPEGWPWQAVAEHVLAPSRLLAGEGGGLTAIQPGQTAFQLIMSHGDPFGYGGSSASGFHLRARLDSCIACHGAVGLASVNSYTGIFTGPSTHLEVPLSNLPRTLVAASEEVLAASAVDLKRGRADWGALRAWAWAGSE